jgi:hypothetical protein
LEKEKSAAPGSQKELEDLTIKRTRKTTSNVWTHFNPSGQGLQSVSIIYDIIIDINLLILSIPIFSHLRGEEESKLQILLT